MSVFSESPRRGRGLGLVLLCLVFGPMSGWSVTTQAVREDDYEVLSKGRLESVALSSDGFLMPAHERRTIGDARAEIVWDVLAEPGGSVLCATGHDGRLMRVVDPQTSHTVLDAEEPELTALTRLPDDSVLVAAAPTGRIYRVAADDSVTTFAQLEATFVWRLVTTENGAVLAATGTEGRLFRMVQGERDQVRVETLYTFKSRNLLDLWIDQDGRMGPKGDIFLAGQNPGWLYRCRPGGDPPEVVYDAGLEEIRALAPMAKGLALAMNTERAPSAKALSLTLRMAGAPSDRQVEMPSAPGARMPPPPPSEPDDQLKEAMKASGNGGKETARSQVVQLDRNGFVRDLWTSPERPIHDLAVLPDGTLLAAAGDQGRLFTVDPDGTHALVGDVREQYIVRLRPHDGGILLGAARNGMVFDLEFRRAGEADYYSRSIDAGVPVRWGRFYVRARLAERQAVKAAFRVGNAEDPESELWSEWTEPVVVPDGQPVPLPAHITRYLQYRLTLTHKATGSGPPPRVDFTELFFRAPNAMPRIESFEVQAANGSEGKAPKATSNRSGNGASSSSNGDGLEARVQAGGQEPHTNPRKLELTWKTSDPNGDALQSAVYFRAADEQVWKPIEEELTGNSLSIGVGEVADGRYRFRLVTSDRLSNAPTEAMQAEEISNEVVIDNSPPRLEIVELRVKGRTAHIRLDADDRLSLLSSLAVDVDNKDPRVLHPIDGIMDQQREAFRWDADQVEPGEHVATFTLTDRQVKKTVKKAVFVVEEE